jgi:hypothetical protein
VDDPGEGYNDPVLGPARLGAMQYAADLWGSFFEKTFPTQAVDVRVAIDPLSGFDGIASAPRGVVPPERNSQTTVSHLEMLLSRRFPAQIPRIVMSSTADFFLGTNGKPGTQLDFVTTALHEFGHLFGFITGLNPSGNYDRLISTGAEVPSVYDRFVVDVNGKPLISLSPAERIAAATSWTTAGLFWDGPHGIAGNGGQRPLLQAFTEFDRLDTIVHLSGLGPEILMDPAKRPGEVIHELTPMERGMFEDLGWTLAPLQVELVSEPGSALLVFGGLAGLAFSRRRRGEPDLSEVIG